MAPSKRDNAEERLARIEMLLKQQQPKTAGDRLKLQEKGRQKRKRQAKAALRERLRQGRKKK